MYGRAALCSVRPQQIVDSQWGVCLGDGCVRPELGLADIEAHVAYFADQERRPAIHIVVANALAHPLHSFLFFLGIHLQGRPDRLRRLVDIIGIHL